MSLRKPTAAIRTLMAAVWLAALPLRSAGAESSSQAQEAPQGNPAPEIPDTVELKGGGFIRGLVIEYLPGERLVIRTAEGKLRELPLTEVIHVERGGKAEAPPQAPGTSGARPSLDDALSRIDGPRLTLRVEADRRASLERRIVTAAATGAEDRVAFHIVCQTPCQVSLPTKDAELYRVGAPMAQPTPWFSLPSDDAQVQATLVHHSYSLWPRGLFNSGLVFGGLGATFWGLHAAEVASEWASTTGIVLALVGATSILASGVVWAVRPASQVHITPLR